MHLTNNNGDLSFGSLIDAVQNVEDYTSLSMFQYTKRSIINSRVFIDQVLYSEPILKELLQSIMNLYTGLILTAVNMNQYITSTRKVRDVMSVVATEGFSPSVESLPTAEDELFKFITGKRPKMEIVFNEGGKEHTEFDTFGGGKVTELAPKNPVELPSGRSIEVTFGGPDRTEFKVNLFLQLSPRFIPSEVAAQFIAMNFTPDIRQRWMQVQAGEISFIKDFLFSHDERKRRMKALKNDRGGDLKEMIERQENSLSNSWLKFAFVTPERQNIANSILIMEKNNFNKACSRAGLNWKNYDKRQKFFNKTFSMMACVVDPMYHKIDTYYHGLDATSSFTYDHLKKSQNVEASDLVSIMKSYANGMAPRFA